MRLALRGGGATADAGDGCTLRTTISPSSFAAAPPHRALLQLYGGENDGTADLAASVVVSLRAVGALQALVPGTLPPPTPQQAGATAGRRRHRAPTRRRGARTCGGASAPCSAGGEPKDHAAVLEGGRSVDSARVQGPGSPRRPPRLVDAA